MSKETLDRLSKLLPEKVAEARRQRVMQVNKDRAVQLLLGIKLSVGSQSTVQIQYK